MSLRLVIITEIISPYRIPLFNALSRRMNPQIHVVFLAETDPVLRQWNVYKEEIKFSFEVLPSSRARLGGHHVLLNRGMRRALKRAQPDVILCGGYNYPAAWQALLWSRNRRIPFVLWSESHEGDMRRGRRTVEFLKSEFLRRCSGFVVPGTAAREYLCRSGVDETRIFTAVNAIDNMFFSQQAEIARNNAIRLRAELRLPERYILFTGRLVREKGIFELLAAYAELEPALRDSIGLVFVGDGPSREELKSEAASVSPGVIRFVGFAQREHLPAYYALADMLVLPTHTDTWGMVVNEAMACGLPIVVSNVAGCAADLVNEGLNGRIVRSKDVSELSFAIRELAENPDLLEAMRLNSIQRIGDYSPQQWSDGIVQMVEKIEFSRG
jgi:1,2-diacylglycerol 3-alpha-glucosyltransferase